MPEPATPTPEPWYTEQRSCTVAIMACLPHSNTFCLAEVYGQHALPPGQQQANALLMVSAPSLSRKLALATDTLEQIETLLAPSSDLVGGRVILDLLEKTLSEIRGSSVSG